ncbi:MAG TPA: hypothetical protein VHF90_03805 [Thermoleophilaceae bacterium]|nr:hypothetical protein [Thermoleophilaceae bacterium]
MGKNTAEGCGRNRCVAVLLAIAATSVAMFGVVAPAAATLYVDSYFGDSGSAGGLFSNPNGVAVHNASGSAYVVDRSNNRVQQFNSLGQFVRAWGRDVVSAGPGQADEQQLVTVNATGGSYTLTFSGQTTAPISAGATAAQVQTALEDLSNLAPGDVIVSGGPGDAGGTSPYVLQFAGAQANANVTQTSAANVDLSGGAATVTTATGNEGATGFEICVAGDGDTCKSGTTTGGIGGAFNAPRGIAVNQATGDLYVTDGSASHRRVQQFSATGQFIRTWGQDVIAGTAPNSNGTGFEICDTTATPANFINQCKAGVSQTTGGAFGNIAATEGGYPAVVPAGAPNAGNVLVADPGNRRVQEFTAAGVFVRAFGADVENPAGGSSFEICTVIANCKAGATGGTGLGQFDTGSPSRVAADATGAIYALERAVVARRVQKFTPQAGPPALAPSLFADAIVGTGGGNDFVPMDIAVNPANGRVYVTKSFEPGVFTCPDGSPSPDGEARVLELTASGDLLDTHAACAGFSFSNTQGLAFRPASGPGDSDRIYLSSTQGGHRVYVLDDDGITPAIASINPATNITDTSADFSATINPNSVDNSFAPTTWRIEYSRNGEDWTTAGSGTLPTPGTTPQTVTASASDLLPATTYQIRVVTRKPFGNPDIASPELTFRTDAIPPQLSAVRADSISATSARLTGQVNPHGTPTNYRFEWGQGNFNNVIPVPDAPVGSGPVAVFVSQQLVGLQPSTTYQFRLVATSATEGATTSPTRTFTTSPPGASAAGADGRGYELVSPADKVGGTGVGEWYRGTGSMGSAGIAAQVGDRFAVNGSFGSTLVDGAHAWANDWAFADRVSGQVGWRSHSPLTHPNYRATLAGKLNLFSTTPSLADIFWASPQGTPAMFPEIAANPAWGTPAGMLSDWGAPTRWELFGPATPSQIVGSTSNVIWGVAFADDGSLAAGVTEGGAGKVVGLGGTQDPTHPTWGAPDGDLVSGRSIYLADVSGAPRDAYDTTLQRTLANVCTGSGADRTDVPAVDLGGNLTAQDCADQPGREDLVSDRGATLRGGALSNAPVRIDDVVSNDGSRVFFMSPDPTAAGVPNGLSTFCQTTGQVCPTQLFVRQSDESGVQTRWISKAEDGLFGSQDASLTGTVRFEGASADGDKVFFRTNSPLTADDPNGTGAPAPPGGVTTGTASNMSWDLYMYDLPDAPGADLGEGELTRLSGGPEGEGDCNSPLGGEADVGALRFVSDDGARVYFTCAAPLPDVPASSNGTVTSPGGTQSTSDQTNLYAYDGHRPVPQRWRFVARIPRSVSQTIDTCASTGLTRRSPIAAPAQDPADLALEGAAANANCVNGTSTGAFVTFFTTGRLTGDDPASPATGDVYGYDVEADELVRISAPQGGAGGTYPCAPGNSAVLCFGDSGVGSQPGVGTGSATAPLGLATNPTTPGDRLAFVQSRSRLLPEDTDSAYDVYEWRNGDLSLVSTGKSSTDGALYMGNDSTGRNVYFVTRDKLTWQDIDVVADVYSARIGGGIPQPAPLVPCTVLAGACHDGGAGPAPVPPRDTVGERGQGDATPSARKTLTIGRPSRAALRRAARRGVLALRIRSSGPGRIVVKAKGRVAGRKRSLGTARKRLTKAGATTIKLKLKRSARRQLRAAGRLNLVVTADMQGARAKAMTVRLKRGRR